VACVRVPSEGAKIGNNTSTERVQMKVADEFEEVGFVLYHDRLVPILEEMADPVVPPVECSCIPCEEASHAAR
jgi:hypothetical protein